ncbi:MAG TPA: c-type cytochrome [Gemmatimonadetes bacterium]|nr:c-type cytochrome [Gemmatimonadota bacterium]
MAIWGGVAFALSLAMMPLGLGALQEDEQLGKVTYDRWCSECHGVDGDGTGSAAGYMLPRPRDFTLAMYNIRTTASGDLPTDQDLLRAINMGAPGTAMPAWDDVLTEAEKQALVQYLKTFSRFFPLDENPVPLVLGSPTGVSEEVIAEGRGQYEAIECWKCHGDQGRGDGESAATLMDDTGFPIAAADLTENWFFNGGADVEDIYRALRTGLDGSPMPNFSDVLNAGVMTDEELWAVAHYVRSLAPEDTPGISEVVLAKLLTEGAELATSFDDQAWEEIEGTYIPLVGQIIVKPRWFDPRVDGVWVKAMHNGDDISVLVSWSDPNNSPDPLWSDWKSQVTRIMEPREAADNEIDAAPDQLVVQFPMQMPEGMERPYFLKGDSRRPVYLWEWKSDRQTALEGEARGVGTESFQDEGQDVSVKGMHSDGQWQVVFTRPLLTSDENDLDFITGEAIPMSFFAWDGDNGESGNQGSLSSWYFLLLEEPTSTKVYVAPPIAMLIAGALGFFIVRRVQKREMESFRS